MKSCSRCGESFADFIDFCFVDGTVLGTIERELTSADFETEAQEAPDRQLISLLDPPPPGRIEDEVASEHGEDPEAEQPSAVSDDGVAKELEVRDGGNALLEEGVVPVPHAHGEGYTPPSDDQSDEIPIRPVSVITDAMPPEPLHEIAARAATPVPPPKKTTPPAAAPRGVEVEELDRKGGGLKWLLPAVVGLALVGVAAVALVGVVGLGLLGTSWGQGEGEVVAATKTQAPPVEPTRPAEVEPTTTVVGTSSDVAIEEPPIEIVASTGPPSEEPATNVAAASTKATTGTTTTTVATTGTSEVKVATTGTTSESTTTTTTVSATGTGTDDGALVETPWGPSGTADAIPAHIEIRSVPAGGRVRIDGREQGTEPFIGDMVSGRHRIEVDLDGYEKWVKEVDLGASGFTTTAELKALARTGPVLVVMPGATADHKLYVDDKPYDGVFPLRMALTEGTHTFKVTDAAGRSFQVTRDVAFDAAGTMYKVELTVQ